MYMVPELIIFGHLQGKSGVSKSHHTSTSNDTGVHFQW